MKKLVSALIIMTLLLSAVAFAESPAFLGTWYLHSLRSGGTNINISATQSIDLILDMTLTFNRDKSFDLTAVTNGEKESVSGSWTSSGNKGTLEYEGKLDFICAGGTLILCEEDVMLFFTRKDHRAAAASDISKAMVLVSDAVYTGKALKPGVTVLDGDAELKKGADYTLSYRNNKSVGLASVVVKGKGKYTGSLEISFCINPKATRIKKLIPESRSLTVKWAKQSRQCTGYEIEYSTSKSFENAKTVVVGKATATSYTIKRLKKDTKYFVRIRTYKKSGGVKLCSAWSSVGNAKTK